MVKIKVSNPNFFVLFLFIGFFLLFFCYVLYISFEEFIRNIYSLILFMCLVLPGVIIFVLFFGKIVYYWNKFEYVSDMYIDNDEISLVYKIWKKYKRTEIIKKNDIKRFDITLQLDRKNTDSNFVYGLTTIKIFQNDNTIITSYVETNGVINPFNKKAFGLILDLLKYSNLIPGFKFKMKKSFLHENNEVTEQMEQEIKKYLEKFGIDYSAIAQKDSDEQTYI